MASHVELSDTRHITGRGETLDTVKFPKFHIFDANWALKLLLDEDGQRISLNLSHRRRNSDDQWEMTGIVGFRVEINGKSVILEKNLEKPIDCRFSHVKNRLKIENFGFLSGNLNGRRVEVEVQVYMKIHKFMGIQPRYYFDFSQALPIFSDTSILCFGRRFHVNRTIVSMASPLFFRHFLKEFEEKNECELKIEEICGFLKDPGDFRRILNLVYPPHLVPKQWIKEPCWRKQLADIYRILEIAKSLEIAIAMETADEWIAKYGRFDLGKSIVLAQDFGLRRLMGAKISSITDVSALKNLAEFQFFNQKTKALIFDHLISLH